MLSPRRYCSRLNKRVVGSRALRQGVCGFDPTCFKNRGITLSGQLWLRFHANAFRRSRFWHHYFECAIVERRLGIREVNLTRQINDTEHQLLMPERMDMFSRMKIFAWLGLSTDAQSAWLKTDLDLLPVEPRNFGACGKLF